MNLFDNDEIIEVNVSGQEYCMPRGEYHYLIEKLRQFDSHYRPQLPPKTKYPFRSINMGNSTVHTHNIEAFHPDKIEPPKQP